MVPVAWFGCHFGGGVLRATPEAWHLAERSRLDDLTVVSVGRGEVTSLWLDIDGTDVIIERNEVVDA